MGQKRANHVECFPYVTDAGLCRDKALTLWRFSGEGDGRRLCQGRMASQHQIERIESPVPSSTEEAATRLATPYILAKR